MTEGGKKQHPLLAVFHYFREAKEELGKVAWPSRQETSRYSALVIGVSVAVGIFLGVLGWALSIGLAQLVTLSQ